MDLVKEQNRCVINRHTGNKFQGRKVQPIRPVHKNEIFPIDNPKDLAEAVKILRTHTGMPQEKLSEQCGYARSTVRRIEWGNSVNMCTVIAVLNSLGYELVIKRRQA